MLSFSRIFSGVLLVCVIAGGIYYCKNHQSTQNHLASLQSYEISNERFLVHSRYGFPVVSLDKSLEEKESQVLPFILEKLLPLKGSVLHLGAHTGLHTILVAKHQNFTGKVLAFEGHPKLFSLLKENIALHKIEDKVQIFQIVPSSKASSLSVCFEAKSTLSADTPISKDYEQSVKGEDCHEILLRPLDQLSLPRVDFILIENDIDAPHALEGAKTLIKSSHYPPLLIVPSSPLAHSKDLKWLHHLKEKGYYFYKLSPTSSTSFAVERLAPQHLLSNGSHYLFFSRDMLAASTGQ